METSQYSVHNRWNFIEYKDIEELHTAVTPTDVFRTSHPTVAEHTFLFPQNITEVDHSLGRKSKFHQIKKIEIILNVFSSHSALKLEVPGPLESKQHFYVIHGSKKWFQGKLKKIP